LSERSESSPEESQIKKLQREDPVDTADLSERSESSPEESQIKKGV
jgi:hypothetical protein